MSRVLPPLQASDAGVLCDWVLQLLKRYSSHKQGQVSVAASKRLRLDAETETYRDLRALLRLLTHLTQRDLLDFQSPEAQANGHPVDVAQVPFQSAGRPVCVHCPRGWCGKQARSPLTSACIPLIQIPPNGVAAKGLGKDIKQQISKRCVAQEMDRTPVVICKPALYNSVVHDPRRPSNALHTSWMLGSTWDSSGSMLG